MQNIPSFVTRESNIPSNNINRVMAMDALKYKVIQLEEQYEEHCDILEELVFGEESEKRQDEIELLTLLIEDWDERHRLSAELDPVELLQSLMDDHELNQNELAEVAGVGKSYISEILNYKKRMSKKVIRNIADHFRFRQAFIQQDSDHHCG